MALIKCPDCKALISDSADACPRCGCHYKNLLLEISYLKAEIADIERMNQPQESNEGIGCLIFTIVVAVAVFLLAFLLDAAWLIIAAMILGFGGLLISCIQGMLGDRGYKRNLNSYNQTKASLPQKKARLAQLEARFK